MQTIQISEEAAKFLRATLSQITINAVDPQASQVIAIINEVMTALSTGPKVEPENQEQTQE